MKKSEYEYIQKKYTKYMNAIYFMETSINLLNHIEYKVSIFTLYKTDGDIKQIKKSINKKLKSMIDARKELYYRCVLLRKMMKKFKIEIPKVMVGLPHETEYKLNKINWKYERY